MRYKFGLNLFFFVSSACVLFEEATFGRDLFFLFSLPHNKQKFECFCAANQIKRKNGILRVRIDISGSLSGFEYCGENEECGTKSIVVIDACLEDESDSVVVDLLCD